MAKTKTVVRDEKQVSNGAEFSVAMMAPYLVEVTLTGTVPLLFHSWNTESVEEKAAAPKNSKLKKTDDIESYVYRDPMGNLGIAGKCLLGAICDTGRFFQDPRSPRKSARDLCKAGVQVLSMVAPFEPTRKKWDYEDKQRVVIQRSAITRTRPAMKEGWICTFRLQVTVPEYISPTLLHDILNKAGMLTGLCDFRPTYGRFRVTKFNVLELK